MIYQAAQQENYSLYNKPTCRSKWDAAVKKTVLVIQLILFSARKR